MAGEAEPPTRVVVIGCGAISEEHLHFLSSAETVQIEAVCDLSPALAETARDRYGAKRAHTDVDAMLTEMRPDVVHVLTPPHTHSDMVRRSIAAGAHVICEKPLAPSADETKALLRSANSAGKALVETRNLLYNDIVQEFDRAIAAGCVGEVREVDVSLALDLGNADIPPQRPSLPAGLAHDYLPHLAYIILHFAKSTADPAEVVGTVQNLSGRPEIGIDHIDALVSMGRIRGRLKISPDILPHSFRVTVRGTNGSLDADLYQPFLRHEGPPWVGKRAPLGLLVQGAQLIRAGARNVRNGLLQHGTYHGMAPMLAAVYEALRAGHPLPVTEVDMIASAMLIDHIVDLTQTRR